MIEASVEAKRRSGGRSAVDRRALRAVDVAVAGAERHTIGAPALPGRGSVYPFSSDSSVHVSREQYASKRMSSPRDHAWKGQPRG